MALIMSIGIVTVNVWADNKDLKNRISAADKKIEEANKKLKAAKEKKASAEEQKKIIDGEIEVIVSNILYINGQIDDANEQIAQKEVEIEEAQGIIDRNKEYFKKRVVSMYKSGTTTHLEMLFGSKSLSDFFNVIDLLQYILKNDRKVIDDMTAARDAIIDAKKVIEKKKAELEESKTLLVNQKGKLDTALAEQQNIIEQMGSEIEINEKEAADAQAEKDALNRQLEEELKEIKDPPSTSSTTSTTTKVPAYTGGKMAWPVPAGGRITSPFGYRSYPSAGLHTGLDIAIAQGNTIVAAASGTVIRVVHGTTGYGKYLMINHGNGTVTLYGHTSKIVVAVGQTVSKGQKIAEIGSTGFSTGPHLHFEVRLNGKAVNPIGYIT